ncbi:(2Fe-2S)-binding protein [Streptomyces sp. ST2-7A]|uniref:(2Fe-2S)-binding protein n=1 Tax=Streptomyces sp. ST2-7A TaxID=2907214 RepID=UPI001F1944CD|nr:(2Fe-2S)-binding protein [Streptomyces sp. ST2-7A]MCE7079892.1 (2Fe-2S)-binding protein [Streptomyces sp. ST2-7A]
MTSPAQAPPATVAAALADTATLGGFFAPVLAGPDEGWHPVAESYAAGSTDLIADSARRYGTTEPRVAASVVQLGHAARLWSPLLACAVAHGVVPDPTRLQRADDGPALRFPTPAGWWAREPAGTAELLYRLVVEERLAAMAAGLRVRVAPRLLIGNAASALVEAGRALTAARPELREPATDLVTRLLATGALVGTGEITDPDLAFRRRSCCLFYRVPPGDKCGDCSLDR